MTARFLTVDDSTSLRMAIRIALSGAGYAVTEAETRFDMIATDPNMLNMDGLTMIRALRSQPAQAKAAGATGSLVKPFVPDQLVKVACKVLGQ